MSRTAGGGPLVKICGVTRPEDAEAAVELGADLLGLNFYPPSPRCLSLAAARAVAAAVAGRVPLVGVFVDRRRDEIDEIASRVGLDLVQLHGDEPAADVAAFGGRAIQVFRVDPEIDPEIDPGAGERLSPALLAPYRRAWGFLFDVRHPRYGGTGRRWRYAALAGLAASAEAAGRPLLVAGGVGPETAADALAESGASGVDVCSGVESSPGRKDRLRLERLMAAVSAFPGETAAGERG